MKIFPLIFFLSWSAPLLGGTVATAEDPSLEISTPPPSSPWHFRLAPYLWLTQSKGTVGVGSFSRDVDLSKSDTLSNFSLGVMFITEIGYERWSLENDVIYAKFESSAATPGPLFGKLNSTLNQIFWTSLMGYRVIECDRFSLDLQAGFRLVSLGSRMELNSGLLPGRSEWYSRTWVDPVIGLRTRTNATDWLFLAVRGDIGGFGANSELTWQAFAGAGVQVSRWFALLAGYRAIGYDYDQAGFQYDVVTHGPAFGMKFNF